MKRYLAAVLSLILLTAGLIGCSAKHPKNDSDAAVSCFREPQYKLKGEGRQTLVLWSQEPEAERVYIQRAIKNFEEATGNRVKVKSYPCLLYTSDAADE